MERDYRRGVVLSHTESDELLEITPKSLRMRKRELNHELRARAAFRAKQQG